MEIPPEIQAVLMLCGWVACLLAIAALLDLARERRRVRMLLNRRRGDAEARPHPLDDLLRRTRPDPTSPVEDAAWRPTSPGRRPGA